jgi:hypothetical protein
MALPVHLQTPSCPRLSGPRLRAFGRVRVWFDDSALALAGSAAVAVAALGILYLVAGRIARPPVPTPSVSLQLVADEPRGRQDGAAGNQRDPLAVQGAPHQPDRVQRDSPATDTEIERPETPVVASRRLEPAADSGNLDDVFRVASAELQRAKGRRSAVQGSATADESDAGRSGRTGQTGDQPSARFFGLGADGAQSVAYVIDCSGSMRGGKLELAKAELLRSIRGLDETQSFRVIFFKAVAIPMPGDGLLPATLSNKIRAEEWFETIEPSGGTDPTQATLMALRDRPEAVYILSDGQFPAPVCDVIRGENRGAPRATIYTIGFADRSGEAQLTRLARESGGKYRFEPLSAAPIRPRGRRR